LQLCHAAVHIPADPGYTSLNLAAAGQVLAYELPLAMLGLRCPALAEPPAVAAAGGVPARHAEHGRFFAQLADTLDAIAFHMGRARQSAMRKLRRIFLRRRLDGRDVRLLRGVLADAQRMARLAGERNG